MEHITKTVDVLILSNRILELCRYYPTKCFQAGICGKGRKWQKGERKQKFTICQVLEIQTEVNKNGIRTHKERPNCPQTVIF